MQMSNMLVVTALVRRHDRLVSRLFNLLRGGSANLSQKLMRWRVGLQSAGDCDCDGLIVDAWLKEIDMVVLNRIYTRTGDDGTTA